MAHGSSYGRLSRRGGRYQGQELLGLWGTTERIAPFRCSPETFLGVFTQGKRFFPVWNADTDTPPAKARGLSWLAFCNQARNVRRSHTVKVSSIEGRGRRTGLFLRRDEAKLLHEAKCIVVAVVTDNLPIPDSIHITKPHFA